MNIKQRIIGLLSEFEKGKYSNILLNEYFSKNNNTIPTHIRHLREKMGDSIEKPKYIKTIWGVGYKFEE